MKTEKLFLFACLALLSFASCTDEAQELANDQPQALKQIVMTTQDFQLESDSRTLYEIGEAVKCTWAANDTVGVFPDEGAQAYFPMASGAGTKNATFDGKGWALKDGRTYGAYYPCIGKFYLDRNAVPVSYAGQTQKGNASTAHLGAYDYMVAAPTTSEFGSAQFMFSHLSSLIQLRITVPQPATLTSVKLVAETKAFSVEGTVGVMADAPSIISIKAANEIVLNLQDVATNEENQVVTLYMMIPPVDLSGQTLKAVVASDKGNVEVTFEGRNFQAGFAYGLSGEMESTEAGYKDGVVTLAEAGTMKQLLGDDFLNITSLKVVGPINGDDVRCLRQMLGGYEYSDEESGKLVTLDLSEASIVEGGKWYLEFSTGEQFYTSNDKIGDDMFYHCNLQDIILPNSIKSIGENAFRDSPSLIYIDIPDDVISIGNNAFLNCSSLTSIEIPEGMTTIGQGVFTGCSSLASIEIPNKINSIGDLAFSNCSSLTSIEIPDNVTSIGHNAFNGCISLVSINIPANVTFIGNYAFNLCRSLTLIRIPTGVTSIGKGTFSNCSSLTSIDIPAGVTSISDYAFSGCSSLTSIDIPDGVTSIGGWAFSGCSSLSSIKFGNGVASVGYNAFSSCGALISVYITDLSAWCSIQFNNGDYSNPLNYGIKLYLNDKELTELVIPKGITEIKSRVFMGCQSFTKVAIGNDVKTIGEAAFANCRALTSVEILDGVATIGASAFSNCTSLTSITIDAEVTSIKDATFMYCNKLSTISINEGVTTIGSKAFCDSSNITQFYCYATNPPNFIIGKYVGTFSTGDFKNRTLYVPKGCVVIYESSEWSEVFSIIKEMD